jgi:hypothetical protein
VKETELSGLHTRTALVARRDHSPADGGHRVLWLHATMGAVSDKLCFDVAYRHAVINAHRLNEIRAGLTFAVWLRFEGTHSR